MIAANHLSATEIVQAVKAGTLTVEEIAQAHLARIDLRDGEVHAFAFLDLDLVMARAKELDAMPVKGPLHGVPVGVKDVILTKDMPTAHNNARYAGSRPGIDAPCVDTLRSAGALIIGKTVTTEFAATNRGGRTRNPVALDCTPGGSSSGSAAAVADYQAVLGLGTQTGGSTIRPGSFCGVFAWKPTWNIISREGLKMFSATCDTLGLYGRSADDLMLLADVFAIQSETSAEGLSLEGARIGVCRSPAWPEAEPAGRAAFVKGIEQLTAAGAKLIDLELPAEFGTIRASQHILSRAEGRSAFLNEYRAAPDLNDEFKAIVENRAEHTAAEIRAAYRHADRCRALFDEIAAGLDVVLTPSVTGEAPVGIETTGNAVFNSLWTLMHAPVVNVPGLIGPNGRPIGLSLTSREYEDRKVIGYAKLAAELFSGLQVDLAAAA